MIVKKKKKSCAASSSTTMITFCSRLIAAISSLRPSRLIQPQLCMVQHKYLSFRRHHSLKTIEALCRLKICQKTLIRKSRQPMPLCSKTRRDQPILTSRFHLMKSRGLSPTKSTSMTSSIKSCFVSESNRASLRQVRTTA